MEEDTHEFLKWLGDGVKFKMSDWKENYIEILEQLYAQIKGWA